MSKSRIQAISGGGGGFNRGTAGLRVKILMSGVTNGWELCLGMF